MKVKTKFLILAILLTLTGIFLLGWCSGRHGLKSVGNQLQSAKDTISSYKTIYRHTLSTVYEVGQIIITQKQAIRELELANKDLRALNLKRVSEISALKVQVDTLLTNVSTNGKIITIHDTITKQPANAIILPFEFGTKDKWIDLLGNFDKKGQLGINLKLSLDIDVWSGLDKQTKLQKALAVTDCPYISGINIRSFKIDAVKKKKWGVGLNIGYGLYLSKNIGLSPYIGIGISRNLFSF